MEWLAWIYDPNAWVALVALTILEIVLGIDNIIFISILSGKLPRAQQAQARQIGLVLAMLMRIVLLFSIIWIIRLTEPFIEIFGRGISGRDLIFMLGGLFLLYKATYEIHEKLEGQEKASSKRKVASFSGVIVQIMLLDVVFSVDSVITAVGMAKDLMVMVLAVMIAVGIMLIAVNPVSHFVENHPTVKMLALSFLLLIGMSLVAEGLHFHIPKGYIYFSMGFSIFVEMLNLRLRKQGKPVKLHKPNL